MARLRHVSRLLGCSVALWVAVLSAVTPSRAEDAKKGPVVFAAASMKTALDEIAAVYARKTGKAPVISYASSGVLAKQIKAGAPADIFISADENWMDELEKANAIKPDTRESLLGNALVLVEPADGTIQLPIKRGFDLAGTLGDGKLAVCTVTSCPAGIYGKQALEKLGVYEAVAPKLAQTENVRAALMLVARGEAKLGIVYKTDALAEPKVKVVGTFPEDTHVPITYPIAITASSKNPDAADFERYMSLPDARRILHHQGFVVLKQQR